jgi:uncharacterized metal-binding protein YceD (DUF177 family)
VAKFSQYKIALRNFSKEPQTYEFQLDNNFFKQIDGAADIQKGTVGVVLVVKKTVAAFEFSFDIQGTVYVPCDRCLDDMPVEVNTQNRLFVKFGKEYAEESDEIVIIPEEEGELNVVWFIYEFVALSVPMKRVHPPGKCNKIMSSKLNKYKPNAPDAEEEEDELEIGDDAPIDVDPRWDNLKDVNLED